MSKKKRGDKKSSLNLWYCGVAVLSLIAIIMMFIPNINIIGKLSEETHYACNGIQVIFGFKDGNLEVYSFSILNLITYLLLFFGFVFVFLKLLKVTKSSIVDFVAICALIISGIFFFLMPSFAVCPYASVLVVLKLGIGAIIAGVLSITCALVLTIKLIMRK